MLRQQRARGAGVCAALSGTGPDWEWAQLGLGLSGCRTMPALRSTVESVRSRWNRETGSCAHAPPLQRSHATHSATRAAAHSGGREPCCTAQRTDRYSERSAQAGVLTGVLGVSGAKINGGGRGRAPTHGCWQAPAVLKRETSLRRFGGVSVAHRRTFAPMCVSSALATPARPRDHCELPARPTQSRLIARSPMCVAMPTATCAL